MTAASSTTYAFASPARTRLPWRRFLALLGVCLPVPICAASGLSLPLPATVERIAASLVPWGDAVPMSANEALHAGAGGSIVAGSDERSGEGVVTPLGLRMKDQARIVIKPPGASVAAPSSGATTVPAAPVAGHPDRGEDRVQPTAGSDPMPSAPAAPSESPTPAPGPAATTTEPTQTQPESDPDPVAAVTPVVDEVLAPVAPVVDNTTEAVVETLEPVTTVLPGLGK